MSLIDRPRRLRSNPMIRGMVQETRVSADTLIYPLFVVEGVNIKEEISSMPGQYRYSIDRIGEELDRICDSGVKSILLFGIPKHKDACGSSAWAEDGVVQKALIYIKKNYPGLYCITDVCMCEYTSHGHCGILDGKTVDNDKTLEVLSKTALSHAKAGADMVAPSDMMDGRIQAIRNTLDGNGFVNTPIMSYAVKYASSFYGPFREAAGSAPEFGDRKGYQMDYHNRREAIREAELDCKEGADILMVKPALAYLDIVKEASNYGVPLVAYNVSGEYSMIMAAIEKGYLTERAIMESLTSIKRAGADLIITNFAPKVLLEDMIE